MLDFKSFTTILKTLAIESAKSTHKPTLSSVESMLAYAQALGTTGKKAIFSVEQKDAITFDFG